MLQVIELVGKVCLWMKVYKYTDRNAYILDVIEADLGLAGVFDGLCRERLVIPVPEAETGNVIIETCQKALGSKATSVLWR